LPSPLPPKVGQKGFAGAPGRPGFPGPPGIKVKIYLIIYINIKVYIFIQ
jgi:hypothetical protein